MIKTAEIKARELLSELSLDEKIYQICCQMVYPIRDDYYSKRNYKVGKIAEVIGRECAVAGVRQALTPVVNVVRDCR